MGETSKLLAITLNMVKFYFQEIYFTAVSTCNFLPKIKINSLKVSEFSFMFFMWHHFLNCHNSTENVAFFEMIQDIVNRDPYIFDNSYNFVNDEEIL